jgi:hypothetical protein
MMGVGAGGGVKLEPGAELPPAGKAMLDFG